MNFDEVVKTTREAVLASILSSVPPSPTYFDAEANGFVFGYTAFPQKVPGMACAVCIQPAFDQQTAIAILENRALQERLHEAQCSFSKLACQWKQDTRSVPSARTIAMHPAYQKIMVMGKTALPFILHDLQQDENHWFWALSYIADENPVPPESRGKVHEMAAAWIDWGRKNGYL